MKDWNDLRAGDVIVERDAPFRVYLVLATEGDFNTLLNLTTTGTANVVDSFKETFPGGPHLWQIYDLLEAGS